jgi:hypothetical protein
METVGAEAPEMDWESLKTMTNQPLSFLFFHYGKIPGYLAHAIEHVRIFNPNAEIHLITDSIKDTSMLDRFGIRKSRMEDYPSAGLEQFNRSYRHISCFNEKFERFVLERWFVAETIRQSAPDRIYVMQDSDVAVFGSAIELLFSIPDIPISLSGYNPHFTFIKSSLSGFLNFLLGYYADEKKLCEAESKFQIQRNSKEIFNLGEMQFLFEYLELNQAMQMYDTDTPLGYVDCNIHRAEGFDYMQLRRRPRKKVIWKLEEGRVVPYFKRGDELVKAFILHFQGPGKRVFFRFNGGGFFNSKAGLFLLNQIFQMRWLANLM